MVYVHFAEGFEEVEAVTIVDVLRRGGVAAQSVSVTGDKCVRGAHEIRVCTDLLFEEADYDKCEMIVLPGGMPGSTNLLAHKGLTEKIVSFAGGGKYLAAICAAPLVFGKLGLLEGRNAVTYPGMEENLVGAKVSKDRVVVDGKIITSKGPATAMEFAVELVRILKDGSTADGVREDLLMAK